MSDTVLTTNADLAGGSTSSAEPPAASATSTQAGPGAALTTPAAPPVDAPFASGSTPTPPPPSSPGWAAAAMAVHSIKQIPRPILISLAPTGHKAIAIDLRANAYVWDTALEDFPASPSEVLVGTYPIAGDAPGLAGTTRGIDPLLWMIGLNAFTSGSASWLRPGDKFRLRWWPDLDVMPHTATHALLVKKIAGSMMTVEKLAKNAGVDILEAHQVINALSLMGALRRLEGKNSAPMLPPTTAEFDTPTRERGRHVRRGG